jgi:hypothetical protein
VFGVCLNWLIEMSAFEASADEKPLYFKNHMNIQRMLLHEQHSQSAMS